MITTLPDVPETPENATVNGPVTPETVVPELSKLPIVVIDHEGPASYPDRPSTLVTNN